MSNVQTQGVETLQVNLSREHQGVPWGFRLTGGRDFANALAIQLVSVYFPIAQLGHPRNISIPSDAWLVKSCMLLLGYKDAKLRWKPSNYSLMSIRKFCGYNYSFNPGIFTLLLFVLYTVRFHCRRTPLVLSFVDSPAAARLVAESCSTCLTRSISAAPYLDGRHPCTAGRFQKYFNNCLCIFTAMLNRTEGLVAKINCKPQAVHGSFVVAIIGWSVHVHA